MRLKLLFLVVGALATLGWILDGVLRMADTQDIRHVEPVAIRSASERHLERIRMIIFRGGSPEWDISADEAVADDTWDRVQLKNVNFRSQLSRDETLASQSPEGRIDRPSDLIELSGGVITLAQVSVSPEAQDPAAATKKPQPVEIKSDRMEAHDQQDKATFIGNVVATTEEYVVYSDILDANYDPKTHEVIGFTAKVNVRVIDRKDPTTRGEGREAVYDRKAGEITLTGEPRLIQGEKISTGEKVLVTTKDKKMVVLGSEKNPVRTIVPEKDVRE